VKRGGNDLKVYAGGAPENLSYAGTIQKVKINYMKYAYASKLASGLFHSFKKPKGVGSELTGNKWKFFAIEEQL